MSIFENLPADTQNNLKLYQSLLLKWQKRINLISPGTIKDSWERHFEDSLQLLQWLPVLRDGKRYKLYDIGSGAGFPGLVIAICREDIDVSLIESDQRKCSYLRTVSRETKLKNVSVINERIESAVDKLPPPDIITARALASLDALFGYIEPWVMGNHRMISIFPKGANYQNEIEVAKKAYLFLCEIQNSTTDDDGRVLCISGLQKVE